MSSKGSPKTTIVSMEEFEDLDFKSPSAFYIFTSCSEYLFIHTRDRTKAKEVVDEMFGVGKYTIRAAKMGKASGTESAVGRINSRSRAGMRKS